MLSSTGRGSSKLAAGLLEGFTSSGGWEPRGKASIGSFAPGPRHRAAHHMAICFTREKMRRARESASRTKVTIFCNLILEMPSWLLLCFLSLEVSLVQPTLLGRLPKDVNAMGRHFHLLLMVPEFSLRGRRMSSDWLPKVGQELSGLKPTSFNPLTCLCSLLRFYMRSSLWSQLCRCHYLFCRDVCSTFFPSLPCGDKRTTWSQNSRFKKDQI